MTSHRASPEPDNSAPEGTGRRQFLGYLLAAPTLVVATRLIGDVVDPPKAAAAGLPPTPALADVYDLSDALTDATRPTANLITVEVREDGTIHHASPVSENGQGITTALAMVIAEEMSVPLQRVKVTLADARPELLFNQLTGGSNNLHAKSEPLRIAAAIAREQMMTTAAKQWGVSRNDLTVRDGVIRHPDGRSADYGSLATAAAALTTTAVATPPLKPRSEYTIIGTKQDRIDALEMVTGRKTYAGDLKIPGALPTMVHRGPDIGATIKSVENRDEVAMMPGVTDVGVITNGVAVRAQTFGQCIDAVRALKVKWHPGPLANESDDTVLKKLKDATIPMPPAPPGAKVLEFDFVNYFNSNTPLETGFAVADVRSDSAEIWYASKIPIIALQEIAQRLGLPQNAVTFHVVPGGGSFGRRLFHDPAMDAAEASQLFGKPVRLMWHRSDDFRHGRAHPMAVSRVRATYLGDQVLSYMQHHTSVKTDFGHGLGEIITGTLSKQELGNLSVAEGIYQLTTKTFYNFGLTESLLNEIPLPFWTSSMRNVYSPNVRCAQELMVDQLANAMGKDPLEFRLAYGKSEYHPVLRKAAELGEWGRKLPDGVAQGIAIADEYKHRICTLVEIDCRPETVNREVTPAPEEGYVTGPRVTKVTVVVEPAHVYDPNGFEAQLQGGTNDGIAIALTFSNHIKDGLPLEGSWDQGYYTRQWNTPREMTIHFLPNTYDERRTPGGAGELAVAPAMAAVACAYAHATGTMPTEFPINHNNELPFHPFPTQPPMPQSHTDGLDHAY
ncbi:molybdopterin cofactor-binding domain-containing protein [Haloechinothrix halophila]|uniref:molybdopterin cofactor-binding domain-containing protein n=1 Tax=Haloechinothrix halophila TaxID=1069073 RepID=UPI0003F829CF|nr:molybdopterin cofactor-binding domain-containing protein [Haloechinothrix halophila]